jgi:hypothetical protein
MCAAFRTHRAFPSFQKLSYNTKAHRAIGGLFCLLLGNSGYDLPCPLQGQPREQEQEAEGRVPGYFLVFAR